MGEHLTNVEHFVSRPREIRREPELKERWVREAPGNRRLSDFEEFKKSDAWETWRKREMGRMENEETSIRMMNEEVSRLRKLESTPEPPWALKGIMDKLPDFLVKEGDPAAENRWELLRKDCLGEIARNSRDLAEAWEQVIRTALAELEADGKLSQSDIEYFGKETAEITTLLRDWDKALFLNEFPNLQLAFAKNLIPRLENFLKCHSTLFDKMDGATTPTAKYKVLASVQAVYEMLVRQRDNRLPPPSYSKMLDRINEIPGRQPVPDEIANTFNKSSWYSENPHMVWQELITGAKANLYDRAKQEGGEFFNRFRMLTGIDDPRDDRHAINYRIFEKRLSKALEDWSKMKITWPANKQAFDTAHEISYAIGAMKTCVDGALGGPNPGERAIRERFQAILDGTAQHVANQLELLK